METQQQPAEVISTIVRVAAVARHIGIVVNEEIDRSNNRQLFLVMKTAEMLVNNGTMMTTATVTTTMAMI